jgi:hypothetical protein
MSILTSILALIGCKNDEKIFLQKNKIYYYGTKEFNEYEKSTHIKLDEAWNIQKEYARKNNQTPENWLFFIINDNYVFNSAINPKESKVFLGGIWVNSKTGDAKPSDLKILLKYKTAYNGDGEKFPF